MKAAGWVFLTTDIEAGNTVPDDDNHSTMKTSPGVLSDNADLECDDTFTDTQLQLLSMVTMKMNKMHSLSVWTHHCLR